MNLSLKQRLFYFFPTLLCFCLPFGSLVLSGLIVLWTIVSLFNIDKEQFKKGIANKNLWWLLVFFIYTLISALFSSNKAEAGFSIEIKMCFLLFPFLFFCFKWPIAVIKRCIVSFVSGCFFACLVLVARACYYATTGHTEYFFYTQFSLFIHASYFAMYLILAIALIVLLYPDWFKTQKNVTYTSYLFVITFIITIFLCSSKLGLISFFISAPLISFYKYRSLLNVKKISYLIIGIIVLGFFSYKLFPEAFNRLSSLTTVSSSSSSLDKTSSESTTVRILIWEQCIQIMKDNFWFGTGVGDANDALYGSYEANGLTGAFSHKFNAHNQYFQTFIGLGVIGFLILLSLTVGYLVKGIIKKHFLLFLFSLLIVLNFTVESMLQASAGVLFFVFFFCLFNLVNEEELLSEG
ncbi:MAG: O-antigen ligase family protein [Bacteroidetes bacterium]|nr:O-antigen ligase family protein [Bacteroidota bacterium]